MARLLLVAALMLVEANAAARRPQAEHLEGQDRLKKNPLGFNARGFHDDIFGQDFGVFHTVKRSRSLEQPLVFPRHKRALATPKRRPEMGSSGFHGDTFSGDFGQFWTMKKNGHAKRDAEVPDEIGYSDISSEKKSEKILTSNDNFAQGEAHKNCRLEENRFLPHCVLGKGADTELPKDKNSFETVISNFLPAKSFEAANGIDEFHKLLSGLNSVETPENDADFKQYRERHFTDSPEPGLHSFVDIWKTVENPILQKLEKRRPEMGSSGFHGNLFSNGFGEFWTMKKKSNIQVLKKRRPEMGSSGFHGNMFSNGFGEFWTMKKKSNTPLLQKRKPEMGSSGFHGNMFSNGFGEFWTMKKKSNTVSPFEPTYFPQMQPMKRKPEMDSFGFHGDTFNNGFGDFWPMKRSTFDNNIYVEISDLPVKTHNYTI